MRFSQRVGITPEKPLFQHEVVSVELRSGIWDGFDEIYLSQYSSNNFLQTTFNSTLEGTFKGTSKYSTKCLTYGIS
jgi:hypothetical protein